jgi:hypothetical protein
VPKACVCIFLWCPGGWHPAERRSFLDIIGPRRNLLDANTNTFGYLLLSNGDANAVVLQFLSISFVLGARQHCQLVLNCGGVTTHLHET